jgi:hypothetical protein
MDRPRPHLLAAPVLPVDEAGIRAAYEQLLGPLDDVHWQHLKGMAVRWARRHYARPPATTELEAAARLVVDPPSASDWKEQDRIQRAAINQLAATLTKDPTP